MAGIDRGCAADVVDSEHRGAFGTTEVTPLQEADPIAA